MAIPLRELRDVELAAQIRTKLADLRELMNEAWGRDINVLFSLNPSKEKDKTFELECKISRTTEL